MPAKRTLVISDIHGCYSEFTQLIEITRYSPLHDRLILLGDYVSRGPNSKEVVELVMHLVEKNGAIALQGNHDHRFVNVMEGVADGTQLVKFFEKGGRETIRSYCSNEDFKSLSPENIEEIRNYMEPFSKHISFLKSLPYYFEDEQYIYVHAGLNPMYSLLEQNIEDMLYIKEAFYKNKTVEEKVVIFGHTITVDIHNSPHIWIGKDKIGIDGGCAFGYQLNALEIVDGKLQHRYHIQSSVSPIN